ncbi:unknown [Euproctis pseudoconspersa nucleopolyhedrovirus]|uniref:LEF-10 n=1 Tax=Euproctis pseudoconspersa nucleopolyhedrovirus TaxID=307467 RepID=C3TWU5_9ABAC|nr:hypothetical protein EupsNPV_gp037 [Euproctis pseudoconspersa nucleopolyhedrovirus]ACO53488.1 unknown [Euproctis pseudoconspersa nucleopolyhedrovirus]
MSSPPTKEDAVLDIILKNNLTLIDNTYIVIHVVAENQREPIKTMCIGEINALQTAKNVGKTNVSFSSVSSELPSD